MKRPIKRVKTELPEPRFTLQSAQIRQERTFRRRIATRTGRNPGRKTTPPETLQ